MITFVLLTAGALCISIILLWYFSQKWRGRINELAPLLNCLACIAALTVFLQFYMTLMHYRETTKNHLVEERAKFNSRMTALASEIICNIQICNQLISEKATYLNGTTVPGLRFNFAVAQDMIRTGEITHHKLRSELMSLITQMQSINTVIEQNMSLMITKHMADEKRQAEIKILMINTMKKLLSHIDPIRSQLVGTQGYLEEFWNSPEKFQKEDYLRKKLLPDALIR